MNDYKALSARAAISSAHTMLHEDQYLWKASIDSTLLPQTVIPMEIVVTILISATTELEDHFTGFMRPSEDAGRESVRYQYQENFEDIYARAKYVKEVVMILGDIFEGVEKHSWGTEGMRSAGLPDGPSDSVIQHFLDKCIQALLKLYQDTEYGVSRTCTQIQTVQQQLPQLCEALSAKYKIQKDARVEN